MEERLFFIGIIAGAYVWLTSVLKEKKTLEKPAWFRVWHGLFTGGVAFIAMMMLAISLESRWNPTHYDGSFTLRQFIWSLLAAAGGFVWGIFKSKGTQAEAAKADESLKNDVEWSETISSAALLAAVMMFFFVQAFKIPSGSMRMTFLEGDHLFVNKFIYGFRIPLTPKRVLPFRKVERTDVVVFRFPSVNPAELHCGDVQYGKDFIKRVIGLPGDTVSVNDGIVYVNNKPMTNESYASYVDPGRIPAPRNVVSSATYQQIWEERNLGRFYGESIRDNFGPVQVPADNYMVMGDNRDRSCDSRYWGPVPDYMVKGKAWFTYWPPSRMGFPH